MSIATAANKTKLELIDWLAKVICDPDLFPLDKPFWADGRVGITNKHIAFVFECPQELVQSSWNAWDGHKWQDPKVEIKPDIFEAFDLRGKEIDPPKCEINDWLACWEEPFKKVLATCEDCDGSGCSVCNYKGVVEEHSIWVNYYGDHPDLHVVDIEGVGEFDKRYLWILQKFEEYRNLSFQLISIDAGSNFLPGARLGFSFDGGHGCLLGIAKRCGFCKEEES